MAVGEGPHPVDEGARPFVVHIPERSTPERWKTEPEDRPVIAVRRLGDDPLIETVDRLVDHEQRHPVADLV